MRVLKQRNDASTVDVGVYRRQSFECPVLVVEDLVLRDNLCLRVQTCPEIFLEEEQEAVVNKRLRGFARKVFW